MTAITDETPRYYVVHPLDDAPEQKCRVDDLGLIRMSPSVRACLITLRFYLLLVMGLAVYRILDLIGLFGHHISK